MPGWTLATFATSSCRGLERQVDAVHRILLAVDDSEGAKRAADFVDGLFLHADVTVTALHVARRPVRAVPATCIGLFSWPMVTSSAVAMRARNLDGHVDETADRTEVVAGAVMALQAPGADHVGVVFGEPIAVISEVAEQQDADLIVVGTSDRGFFRRLIHRSVSRALARKSPRPVLIVR